jgi:hypothetical protein
MLKRWLISCTLLATLVSCTKIIKIRPIAEDELQVFGEANIVREFNKQPPPTRVMGVNEVISRVLKYNLERKKLDLDFNTELTTLKLKTRKLLPELNAKSTYTYRDKVYASKQLDLDTDEPIAGSGNTYSSERKSREDSLSVSWNILSLWQGYLGAKTQADRTLLAREQRRKKIIDFVTGVIEKYWLVSYGQKYTLQGQRILRDIDTAIAKFKDPEFFKNFPEESLKRQKILLEQKQKINQYQRMVNEQKIALAFYMGLPPDADIRLKYYAERIPVFNMPTGMSDRKLLARSPGTRIAAYSERIAVRDSKAQFAQLFPALALDFGFHKTTDSLRVFNSWRQGSAQIVWNMLGLVNLGPQRKLHKNIKKAARLERIYNGVMQLAQARLNQLLYLQSLENYADALAIHQVESMLNTITKEKFDNNISANSFMDTVESQTAELYSAINRAQAYADMVKYAFNQAGMVAPTALDADFDRMSLPETSHYVQRLFSKIPVIWLKDLGSEQNILYDSGGVVLTERLKKILTLWRDEQTLRLDHNKLDHDK